MGDSFSFTEFLRKLEALGAGEAPAPEFVEEALAGLWRALRFALRKRGLWHRPPSYLGVYGIPKWSEIGGGSIARICRGEIMDLLAACYQYALLDRYRFLVRRVKVGENVDGLVFRNVQHFVYTTQQRQDPLGFRVFAIVQKAVLKGIERGELHILSGNPKVRNDTLLGFDPGEAARSLSSDGLAGIVKTWNDTLLPEIITANGRARRLVEEELWDRIAELKGRKIASFLFADLVEPLKSDIRARWGALYDSENGGKGIEGEDGERPRPVQTADPDSSFEERDAYRKMVDCISRNLLQLSESPAVRRHLEALWNYLRLFAAPEKSRRCSEDSGLKDLLGDELPSRRKLAKALGVPRNLMPRLFTILEELATKCGGSGLSLSRPAARPSGSEPGLVAGSTPARAEADNVELWGPPAEPQTGPVKMVASDDRGFVGGKAPKPDLALGEPVRSPRPATTRKPKTPKAGKPGARENLIETLGRATAAVRDRGARIEFRGKKAPDADQPSSSPGAGRPLGPGDLFVHPGTADQEISWVILQKAKQDLLVVPADGRLDAGSSDLHLPAKAGGPLTLRCGLGIWLDVERIDPSSRLESLPGSAIAAALKKQRDSEAGTPVGTVLEQDVDADPEHREWIEELRLACAALAGSSAAGKLPLARPAPPPLAADSLVVTPVSSAWRSWGVAASLLLVLALALIAGLWLELREARHVMGLARIDEELRALKRVHANPPSAQFSSDDHRGPAQTIEVAAGDEFLLLFFAPRSQASSYRLEILDRRGEEIWKGTAPADPFGTLSVLIPAATLPPGSYHLYLQGVGEDGSLGSPQEYRLKVRGE